MSGIQESSICLLADLSSFLSCTSISLSLPRILADVSCIEQALALLLVDWRVCRRRAAPGPAARGGSGVPVVVLIVIARVVPWCVEGGKVGVVHRGRPRGELGASGVHVTQVEGKALYLILCERRRAIKNVIVRGPARALQPKLRDKVEIEATPIRHGCVDNSAWEHVANFLPTKAALASFAAFTATLALALATTTRNRTSNHAETSVRLLLYDDEDQLARRDKPELLKRAEDLTNLLLRYLLKLVVRHAISVEDEPLWHGVVLLIKLAQAVRHVLLEIAEHLLALLGLRSDCRIELRAIRIHRGHECGPRVLLTARGCVVYVNAADHRWRVLH
mmetsp:Transcript_6787/g.11424  ORF Transcript_6787/g.11424 Transcript_6787/m.11424 type:complete len:334 (-) Transcript_6787:2484-3485(-)